MSAAVPADVAACETLVELLAWRAACTPSGAAYRAFDAEAAGWHTLDWAQVKVRVGRWADALGASGVRHGERVAILLPNGLNAVSIDLATLSRGAAPVPLHAIDNPASVAYILSDSAAVMLCVQSLAQWEAIEGVGLPLPALHTVVVEALPTDAEEVVEAAGVIEAHQTHEVARPRIVGLQAWLAQGEGWAPASGSSVQLLQPEDLAAIVYTSGTTGKPKGVMLTHRNVMANVKAILCSIDVQTQDLFLSFLPLSHTFERTAGYYLPMAAGACVAFARSIPQLAEDLRQVRPTVLVSVPRIYERVHAALQARLATSPVKARLFAWTEAVGWRRFCRAQRLTVPAGVPAWFDALAWPLLDALVARQLRAQFGGRLRAAVSGGAPLSASLAHCFLGLGIPLLQGYGMTETSPVVSVNLPDDNDPLTVGRPLPGVEVRIGPDRELQVRAPSVMKGYLNRPEDTARTVSADGWLGTGDQAAIEAGRVRILGRIKEIIVTSTGEKVPPADLELAITADPLFAQAMVLGEQRPFIAAIVVLGASEWRRLAKSLGLAPDDAASLQASAAREAVLARIRLAAASFPHYAVPRAVCLTTEPWTVENTLLTPTLKLKRQNLMQHFEAEITRLYQR